MVKDFINSHKQSLPGEDFIKRLCQQLDYYPKPVYKRHNIDKIQRIIISCSLFVATLIFTLLGGFRFLFNYAIPLVGIPSSDNGYLLSGMNIAATFTLFAIIATGIVAAIKISLKD